MRVWGAGGGGGTGALRAQDPPDAVRRLRDEAEPRRVHAGGACVVVADSGAAIGAQRDHWPRAE
jgi:hypothetical protein